MAVESIAIPASRWGFLKRIFRRPVPEAEPNSYASEHGDEFFTDAAGDIYARKPDGRVYDLTD